MTTAEPGIPWQYMGHLQTTAAPGYKHVSQRGLFDNLKKRDISKQPASIVDMFARLSCAEVASSVFEPPEGHYLGLEQVGACYVFSHAHTEASAVLSCIESSAAQLTQRFLSMRG